MSHFVYRRFSGLVITPSIAEAATTSELERYTLD
jgi:hypothetical protein